ncbi:DUF883 family protein [Massilia horti]|uniref:DUF883 domain-containing protein n=1 Tax=Massilia horti TaxID=2562153 RepID=A0A4Y9T579_9BURK|nr:DUF883 family protein [Massilia horti]TFW36049.1 DUF883 domain-containing protein [Massilia horti]
MLDTSTGLNGSTALNGSIKDATHDAKALVRDAHALLTAAAALTGEKADELRKRGMELLDRAMGKAGQYQDQALAKGKELAHTADVYVKDNPWRTVAVVAGAALLLGVVLGRK